MAIPRELARPLRIQLVASGRLGPRPLAQVDVGELDGDPRATAEPRGDADRARTSVTGVVELLQSLRPGRAPPRRNRLLARAALVHAQNVCRQRQVAHQLAPGADPESRMRRQGIDARVFGEVVARGASIEAALRALDESPSHRMVLRDRRFTDVGWAAVRHDESVCLVVEMAAWPHFVGRR